MLKAVLGDGVAAAAALGEPLGHLRRALAQGVQITGGDDEQRDAVHAVVIEPVANAGAAVEGSGLHIVEGHRDSARGARADSTRHGADPACGCPAYRGPAYSPPARRWCKREPAGSRWRGAAGRSP